MMRLIGWILIATSFLTTLEAAQEKISPKLNYAVQDRFFKSLSSPFSSLLEEEASTDWGKEWRIGKTLSQDFDLYRAITALKRAHILAPENDPRKMEIEYQILLTYYLGKRYKEIDQLFVKGKLDQATPDFPPFHDLLVILYDTYDQLENVQKKEHLLQLIAYHYPKTHDTLKKYTALKSSDFETLKTLVPQLHTDYFTLKKSPKKAALFNALLPGLGYYYIGLKQTAITALLLNALFIAACIYFFRKKAIAAGIITLSFAVGWYVGGIQGGTVQTEFYNTTIYEGLANPLMNREGIFPIHLLHYGF
jgi:hypothetical protein